MTPFEKFVKIGSFSGILLMITTVVALVWANSPWGYTYHEIWDFKVGFSTEFFSLKKPLILWINDGLMAIFFFLIGLEIKREVLIGELNSIKKMSFPLAGALGGIAIPVLMFFLLNENPETAKGWGIPMATDIAFTLAILKLLGNRVPLSIKIFLTAFAIVDDIGAVLVIAVFYSSDINLTMIGIGLGLIAILYVASFRGYFSKFLMIAVGVISWFLFLKSGIHPTIAGILVAFSVPVSQKIHTEDFISGLEEIVGNIKKATIMKKPILSAEQIEYVDDLQDWTDKYQSPLQHMEHELHDWVAFFIIPLFALANAGVVFSSTADLDLALSINIALSLVIGKGIGVTLFVFLTEKLKLITIPPEITKGQIIGVAFLAGVGFTMSIFIAGLGFGSQYEYIESAKMGILGGSLVAGLLGYLILRFTGKERYGEK